MLIRLVTVGCELLVRVLLLPDILLVICCGDWIPLFLYLPFVFIGLYGSCVVLSSAVMISLVHCLYDVHFVFYAFCSSGARHPGAVSWLVLVVLFGRVLNSYALFV